MDIKNQEGLEIFLGYTCNINCNFCYQKDLRRKFSKNIEKIEVERLLREGGENKKKFVIFSGGEPTLDKNLGFYIELSKRLGYEHIRVHTNGWGFRDFGYLKDLYNKGLTGVTLSIHGYGRIQDLISGVKGNFNFLFHALINFEKLKRKDKNFIIDTNTVICRQNYLFLVQLFQFLKKFSITRRMLVFPYTLDYRKEILKQILPDTKQFIFEVEKVANFMMKRKITDFVIESLPYCIINSQYWPFIEKNYKTDKNIYFVDGKKEKNLQYNFGKIKFPECEKCNKNDICFGFSDDFIKLYGKDIFYILK